MYHVGESGKPAKVCIALLLALLGALVPLHAHAGGGKGTTVLLSQVPPGGGPSVTPTIPVIPAPKPTPQQGAPAVQVPEVRFECPKTTYIDCMPTIQGANRTMCSKEFLEWVKLHCPNVQVVH